MGIALFIKYIGEAIFQVKMDLYCSWMNNKMFSSWFAYANEGASKESSRKAFSYKVHFNYELYCRYS